MSYRDFKTINDIQSKFPITTSSDQPFFADVTEVETSPFFQELLRENVPLALNINTEKARSELIVMQVLVEVRKLLNRQISLFSGIDFTVDSSVGLSGYCDYILSDSPDQVYIKSPVICMVEAKNDNIKNAYPQCIAEMIAAQRFNAAQSNPVETIWGVVTTGSNWKFLHLTGDHVAIDYDEYSISQIGKILAIFQHILRHGIK